MDRRFNGVEQKSLQLSHFDTLRLGWSKNWTGATEVQWVNTSWKELRWEERDERKVEERCQNLRQELRSSGQMMEVCPSSYRQNLFLDPIALHFLNLETSATRLARVLLVYIYIYTIIITFRNVHQIGWIVTSSLHRKRVEYTTTVRWIAPI